MAEVLHATGPDGELAPGWRDRLAALSDQDLSDAMADHVAHRQDFEGGALYLEMVVRWARCRNHLRRRDDAGELETSPLARIRARASGHPAPEPPAGSVPKGLKQPPAGSQVDRSGWIAERFGVSRRTVIRWHREESWPPAVAELLALEDGTHPAWSGFRVLDGEIVTSNGKRLSRGDLEMYTWWLQQAGEAWSHAAHYRRQVQALQAPSGAPRVVNPDGDDDEAPTLPDLSR